LTVGRVPTALRGPVSGDQDAPLLAGQPRAGRSQEHPPRSSWNSSIRNRPAAGKTTLYLVDGNTGNALGENLPKGLLKGVKGTVPGVAAPGNLRERPLKVDPALDDCSYSAESCDAVVAIALATDVAESDAGKNISAKLVEVTSGGSKCTCITACLAAARAGTNFDYDGVSGPIDFDSKGDPSEAIFGVYTYGADNKLPSKVDYRSSKV
jgi:hypothetical protein